MIVVARHYNNLENEERTRSKYNQATTKMTKNERETPGKR